MTKLEKYCRQYGKIERIVLTDTRTKRTLSDSILYYPNKTENKALCRDIYGTKYEEAGKLIDCKKWHIRDYRQDIEQNRIVYEILITVRK